MIIHLNRGIREPSFYACAVEWKLENSICETAPRKEGAKVEPYVVQGSTLVVRQPHLTREDSRFDKACLELISKQAPLYTIDLSEVRIITSTFIGIIAVTYLDIVKKGGKMLVKAPPRVLDIFRMAGFEGKIELKEVPPPA
jgi:anti-anti-sigma regulatory factor